MSFSLVKPLAERFSKLFRGHDGHYGVHIPETGDIPKGEKRKGKSFTKKETMTSEVYLAHVCGQTSVGVVPVDAQGNVRFAAIDIDLYGGQATQYLQMVNRWSIPMVPFCTKSGGLHLIVFFSTDTPARKAIQLVGVIRHMLGLPRDTEVFPKQTIISPGNDGSWINLPYFNHENPDRFALRADGTGMSFHEAVEACETVQTTVEEFEEAINSLPLAKAPPCLQAIFMTGGGEQGTRNRFMFNCATYMKARFQEDFPMNLHKMNSMMDDPLPAQELDDTVISSHVRNDYGYQCTEGVLSKYCDKEMCKTREFGRDSGTVSDLSFENLTQVQCAEPYYKWVVNSVEMTFYSEQELIKQDKFRSLCMRKLHKLPIRLKDMTWTDILNRALSNVIIEDATDQDDMSSESLWLNALGEFLSARRAIRASQINQGLVWQDEDRLWFKGPKLMAHLDATKQFTEFKRNRHMDNLKSVAINDKLWLPDKGTTVRAWYIDLKDRHQEGLLLDVNIKDIEPEDLEPLDFSTPEKPKDDPKF